MLVPFRRACTHSHLYQAKIEKDKCYTLCGESGDSIFSEEICLCDLKIEGGCECPTDKVLLCMYVYMSVRVCARDTACIYDADSNSDECAQTHIQAHSFSLLIEKNERSASAMTTLFFSAQ